MTAKLTITLSDDLLVAMKKNKSLKLALGGGNGRAGAARTPLTARGRTPGPKPKAFGTYRAGSHFANLLAWASGRKRSFGNADVMKVLKIRKGHAGMVLAKLVRDGSLRREGRGAYVAT